MKNITILGNNKLKGTVSIPPSKSLSHRTVIAAALCDAVSNVGPIMDSEDLDATMGILERFGAVFEPIRGMNRHFKVYNPNMSLYYKTNSPFVKTPLKLQCNESGSTIRFMIPFSFLGTECTYLGKGRLVDRPFEPYYEIFDNQKVTYTTEKGKLPLTIRGGIQPGHFKIKGDISSQFITGLLMALPLLTGDSTIEVLPPFESQSYVELTLDVLSAFGIDIEVGSENIFYIRGGQKYKARDFVVEGDYSQAAFFYVANALGNDLVIEGIYPDSKQGDRVVQSFLSQWDWKADCVRTLSFEDCPDLLPIMSVIAALSPGKTFFVKGERVRLKESDRIHAMTLELNKLGARIEETEDGMIIEGVERLVGAQVSAWGDHRIAMALAMAATCMDGEMLMEGAGCVAKSYPEFWSVYRSLGGKIYE